MAARGTELDALLHLASDLRDRGLADAGRPHVITYSRKVFIPLTRLCRDRCHYCTFAAAPADVPAPFLSPDEVLDIARAGAAQECKEALFTLGDRPEERWPQARDWLDEAGYGSTLDYLRAMAVLVLEETGLLPHLNPGVMSWQEMLRLKPVAPSMGLMLETTSTRLWSEPGGPHHGSPDKEPAVRLDVLENAGRLSIPFTTGVLVGIGETLTERAETVLAIRSAHRAHGHVQEVIVQNFRAKPQHRDGRSSTMPSARTSSRPSLATPGAARTVDAAAGAAQPLRPRRAAATASRPGSTTGVASAPLTPDHVNPERPWPHLQMLAEQTSAAGFALRERLTVHAAYARRGERWVDPRVQPHVDALADDQGLAREGLRPKGRPWQEPDQLADAGRIDLHVRIDDEGRRAEVRGDVDSAFGSWDAVAPLLPSAAPAVRSPRLSPTGSRRPRALCGWPSVIRRRCCCRSTSRWRSPCCPPTGPTSTRWPTWPTGSGRTWWATR